VNAFKRLHGLIVEEPGLDSNKPARNIAAGGVDRSMRSFKPRRGRPTARRHPSRTIWSPVRERVVEDRLVNSQPIEPEVREDLVARVRQEIQDGTYDTPEKFEAALDRLADRLESD
jgi:anti-sigma28 factor (negative regulator of flagellin synthesis)